MEQIDTEERKHKETFFQDSEPSEGIPSCWVVQYYEGAFCEASYFMRKEDAKRFEESLIPQNRENTHRE